MSQIGRNEPCSCGSGEKYKTCCLESGRRDHLVGKVMPPSIEEQERLTKDYQRNIRKSPLWKMMVSEYGKEKAEEMLKEFQVAVR